MTPETRHTWQQAEVHELATCRARAVEVAHQARSVGVSQVTVARMLDRSPRTLRDWVQRDRDGVSLATPRGRGLVPSSQEEAQALLGSLQELGPHTGVSVFQARHRDMPRAEVTSMVHRWRSKWRQENPQQCCRLVWTHAGRVWAADHSHVEAAPGQPSVALSCRDLASHQQLLWEGSRETAQRTASQLRACFDERGAPLVLKGDGGPAFRSKKVQQVLDEHGVELLPSPPRCPEYNGSCEAANNSMKTRTRHVAEANGRSYRWQPWDLETARLQANCTTRPWGVHGPVPQDRWDNRTPITEAERTLFRETCARLRREIIAERGLTPDQLEKEYTARSVQRAAVTRALVGHGALIVQRRAIRPPIKTIRSA